MKPETLAKQLKSKNPLVVIDVRSAFEYRNGHIPKSLNIPVSRLLFGPKNLPSNRQIRLIITCEHGPRAVLAKGLLSLIGYKNTELLTGHMLGYRRKGLPLAK